jgi:hypothetical protein
MADIYACAQLTIVAATGRDADQGLLRIYRRSNIQPFSTSLRSLQLLPYPKQSRMRHSMETSKWASRAWTFQECYFSRRRLFFVGEQVIYICNHNNGRLMPVGWSPSQDTSFLKSHDNTHRAMNLISAYSGRHMTYDSDALAAIVSALNTLSDDTMRHIWGLPLRYHDLSRSGPNPYSDGELALFWRHSQPCSRRCAFPSWSPIAWTGRVDWYYIPATNTWKVGLLTHPGSSKNQPWVFPHTSCDFEHAPRYLQITADMARLRLIKAPVLKGNGMYPDLDEQRLFLAFPLDNGLEIILNRPDWDVEPCTIDPENPIMGILSSSETPHLPRRGPIILLVQLHGSFYERIGILQLDCMMNYNPRLFLHNYRYLRFLHKDTAELVHCEVHGAENVDKLGADDIKLPFWEHGNWRSFFVAETIVLG